MSTVAASNASVGRAGRRFRPLESLGRRVIEGGLGRVRVGEVLVVENGLERSFGSADADGPAGRVRVQVNDGGAYAALAFGGSVGAAEAYMDGLWDCDDLSRLFELLLVNYEALQSVDGPLRALAQPVSRALYFLERNTRRGSRRNIEAHYDLSNEFFSLWLDPTMTYSCGIFASPETTLEEAQVEKIDRACRKLELGPDDQLLEIGTGWGSAAIHAAREYGCRVTTTTISRGQHEFARERVRGAGLEDRVTLLLRDYRDLTGRFDKVLSIEMIEAVGRDYLDGYFGKVSSLLKPDGMALLQAITIRDQFWASAARRRDFLKKYIFPGSCLLSIDAISSRVRRVTDLGMVGLEDIGPHYCETLQRWRRAFLDRREEVLALGFDERFCRMWEYYFSYCEGAFAAGHCSDVQVLLAKPGARPRGLG